MEDLLNQLLKNWLSIFSLVFSALIGYVVGAAKAFREQKQKAYTEILPPILKFAYDKESDIDEKEFSKALGIMWLYGSRNKKNCNGFTSSAC